MKPYEIKEINGQKVFFKEISPNFVLINNVYVMFSDGYVVNDEIIAAWLDRVHHPYHPCVLAEDDMVNVASYNPRTGHFDDAHGYLSRMLDQSIPPKARESYDEYKSWAGI